MPLDVTSIEAQDRACTRCGRRMGLEAFPKNTKGKDGRHSWCRDCFRTYRRERRGDYSLLSRYGLRRKDHDALVDQQGGRCAICGRKPQSRLVVDHDHRTGAVRGLLCFACNNAIGLLQDDPRLLRLAAEYVIERTPPIPQGELDVVMFDFDGVLAESVWPDPGIGEPIPGGHRMLKRYSGMGYRVVVWTARPASHKRALEAWCRDQGLPIEEVVCGKVLAGLYVDDHGWRPAWAREGLWRSR